MLRRSDGILGIGAVARQREVERSPLVATAGRCCGGDAARRSPADAHPRDRRRQGRPRRSGGGIPGRAYGAGCALPRGVGARRAHARADELFLGPLITAIEPDEARGDRGPAAPDRQRGAFEERRARTATSRSPGPPSRSRPGAPPRSCAGRPLPSRAVAAARARLAGAEPGEAAAEAAAALKDLYVRALAAELIRRASAEARARGTRSRSTDALGTGRGAPQAAVRLHPRRTWA